MWDKLSDFEKGGVILLLLSAFVDIVQFSWIAKRGYRAAKKRFYDKVKKEILLEQLEDIHRKPKEEDHGPFK